jgi:probable HAF family extracellular repeat protein
LGGTNSFAYGLNNLLQAVGTSLLADNATPHAFLWQNDSLSDLNQLQVYNSAWELHHPRPWMRILKRPWRS